MNKTLESSNCSFTLNETGKSATITYKRLGTPHMVHVPYSSLLQSKSVIKDVKVFLLKGDEKIDITQQPGVRYLVSAHMLGGKAMMVTDNEDMIKYYGEYDVPEL